MHFLCAGTTQSKPSAPFRRESKQTLDETTWLRNFRACCNWPGLKEFCKLYLCQENANASLKQVFRVDERSWDYLRTKGEKQGRQKIWEITESP